MAWNFANWYVPMIEGCCHGTNVPVPYEDGMTFLESNENIITIVNQLIDNNNEIPDIIKEEVKTELGAYLESDEGKRKIEDIVAAMDLPYVSTTGDTMTGDLILGAKAQIIKEYGVSGVRPNNNIIAIHKGVTTKNVIKVDEATDKICINSLLPPDKNDDAANKKYVDDKVAALGNVLVFKGVKATVALLPSTGNNVGDVWYVEATKSAWAWVVDTTDPAGRWDEFGPVIDLEPYFKKADIVQTTGTATDKVMSQKAATDSFVDVTGDTMNGILTFKKSVTGNKGWQIGINPIDVQHTGMVIEPINGADNMIILGRGASNTVLRGITSYPTQDNDAISLGYFNAHSGGSYTLPVATEERLGGIKAPAKTANDNRQVTVDSNGNLWTEDITPYELPVANYNRLGGIKASVDVCPVPERRQGICVEPSGLAWVPKLVPASADILGGIKADESSEAMPVIIAIDPTTHKLKGALMTAYESPTTIGGVAKNGDKTDNDTVPVHMDNDGKQWVTPIGITDTIKITAGETDANIPAQNRRFIIATLLGDEGTQDIWIKTTTYDTNLPQHPKFIVRLNNAVPAGKELTVCYLLF